MNIGKEVYRSVKLTDNVNTTSLSPADEVRLLFKKMSNDDITVLDTAAKLSADKLKHKSALSILFNKAIERMEKKNENSVTLKVASEFLPYIDEVIDPVYGKGRYYNFKVEKRDDIPAGVHYYFIVQIRKKVENESI